MPDKISDIITIGGSSKNRTKYPESFDDRLELLYPQRFDFDKLDVFYEDYNGDYFSISELPDVIGYGKHAFLFTFRVCSCSFIGSTMFP